MSKTELALRHVLNRICAMQTKNYGDGVATHLALIDLCDEAKIVLAAHPVAGTTVETAIYECDCGLVYRRGNTCAACKTTFPAKLAAPPARAPHWLDNMPDNPDSLTNLPQFAAPLDLRAHMAVVDANRPKR